MAVLPVQGWNQGNRQRQPMNYATGSPNDVGSGNSGGGGSQQQPPTAYAPPQMNMNFGMPNSVYANAHMRPGYGMPQGYTRGAFAPQPLPMRFQIGGLNGMANGLAGGMAGVQIPAGSNIQNFAQGNFQGGQPHSMRPMPMQINPNMLVQMRRGVLPTGY